MCARDHRTLNILRHKFFKRLELIRLKYHSSVAASLYLDPNQIGQKTSPYAVIGLWTGPVNCIQTLRAGSKVCSCVIGTCRRTATSPPREDEPEKNVREGRPISQTDIDDRWTSHCRRQVGRSLAFCTLCTAGYRLRRSWLSQPGKVTRTSWWKKQQSIPFPSHLHSPPFPRPPSPSPPLPPLSHPHPPPPKNSYCKQ